MGQWRAVVDIPATPTGPRAARTVVGALLDAWRVPQLRDDAELVISELVTNAVQHAPGTDCFALEIVQQTDGVRLMLADGASIRPLVRELSPDRPSGRGMQIVEALAARWGADDHHGGKRVWVDLTLGEE